MNNVFYYHCDHGRRFIEIPLELGGYLNNDDVQQIADIKRNNAGSEPSLLSVKKSALRLAQQRKAGML